LDLQVATTDIGRRFESRPHRFT